MKKYRLTPEAADDLTGIWAWFRERDAVAEGKHLIQDIRRQFQTLAKQPGMGRERADLRAGLRSFHIGSYLIFFRSDGDDVQIVRVLHGRRNSTPDMFEDRPLTPPS